MALAHLSHGPGLLKDPFSDPVGADSQQELWATLPISGGIPALPWKQTQGRNQYVETKKHVKNE